MSGPLRFRFAAVLILAGFSASPASSNPFTELFNLAPQEAAAPAPAKDAPAKEECLAQPGKPADGQHWVYRLDGHRKCWFLVPEGAKKTVRAAKRRLAAAENDAALREQGAVADARAELPRPALVEAPQPTPPTPAFSVVDAASVPATGAAALVPPPPVLAKPDDPNPRQSNLETLFAATPADSGAAAASVPVAPPIVEAGDDGRLSTAPWIGPLLMTLGLVFLLGSTRSVRRAVLVAENSWAAEGEDRLGLLRSESASQTRPRDRRQTQATPHRPRQTTEDQRKSRPLGQSNQAMTFQEAIKALTDLDAVSVGLGRDTADSCSEIYP